jgi:hypothetical protein
MNLLVPRKMLAIGVVGFLMSPVLGDLAHGAQLSKKSIGRSHAAGRSAKISRATSNGFSRKQGYSLGGISRGTTSHKPGRKGSSGIHWAKPNPGFGNGIYRPGNSGASLVGGLTNSGKPTTKPGKPPWQILPFPRPTPSPSILPSPVPSPRPFPNFPPIPRPWPTPDNTDSDDQGYEPGGERGGGWNTGIGIGWGGLHRRPPREWRPGRRRPRPERERTPRPQRPRPEPPREKDEADTQPESLEEMPKIEDLKEALEEFNNRKESDAPEELAEVKSFAAKCLGIPVGCGWWIDFCCWQWWDWCYCRWYWNCWTPCYWDYVYCPRRVVMIDGSRRVFEEMSYYLGITGSEIPNLGFGIQQVKADSPAERAGLQVGDVITSVNGREMAGQEVLVEAMQRYDGELELEVITGDSNQLWPVQVIADRVRISSF